MKLWFLILRARMRVHLARHLVRYLNNEVDDLDLRRRIAALDACSAAASLREEERELERLCMLRARVQRIIP